MEIPTEGCLCWDFFLGGALVSSAPTALTIRGYVGVRGGCVKTQLLGFLALASGKAERSPFTTIFLVLPDSNIL